MVEQRKTEIEAGLLQRTETLLLRLHALRCHLYFLHLKTVSKALEGLLLERGEFVRRADRFIGLSADEEEEDPLPVATALEKIRTMEVAL